MTPSILLVCDDAVLLRTRAAVLSRTGAVITCSKSCEALAVQQNLMCRMVILCHSLSPATSAWLAEAVEERWPGTCTLQLLPLCSGAFDDLLVGIGQRLPSEPSALVRCVCELLGISHTQSAGLTSDRPFWPTSEAPVMRLGAQTAAGRRALPPPEPPRV